MCDRYEATIAPVIGYILRVLPESVRLSSLHDGNGQMALEHRDLDELPLKEINNVDAWLQQKVDDFGQAAYASVSLSVW